MSNIVDLAAERARRAPPPSRAIAPDPERVTHLMHKALDDLVVACLAADSIMPLPQDEWVDVLCLGLKQRHAREASR